MPRSDGSDDHRDAKTRKSSRASQRTRLTTLTKRARSLHPKSRDHSKTTKKSRLESVKAAQRYIREKHGWTKLEVLRWFREKVPSSDSTKPLKMQDFRKLIVNEWFTRHDKEIFELASARRGRPGEGGREKWLRGVRELEERALLGGGLTMPALTQPAGFKAFAGWNGSAEEQPLIPDCLVKANGAVPPLQEPVLESRSGRPAASRVPKPSKSICAKKQPVVDPRAATDRRRAAMTSAAAARRNARLSAVLGSGPRAPEIVTSEIATD